MQKQECPCAPGFERGECLDLVGRRAFGNCHIGTEMQKIFAVLGTCRVALAVFVVVALILGTRMRYRSLDSLLYLVAVHLE